MITEDQYKEAVQKRQESEEIINQYYKEKNEAFRQRMENNPVFGDDELVYAASARCPCGYGLAYPKGCPPNHYWDCAAILKGCADKSMQHTAQLYFAFYSVKSESERNGSTRVKP